MIRNEKHRFSKKQGNLILLVGDNTYQDPDLKMLSDVKTRILVANEAKLRPARCDKSKTSDLVQLLKLLTRVANSSS